MYKWGNTDILNNEITAFLSSRTISATTVLKAYDWAIAQREKGNCVISGFHSKIEKDVLGYLIKGKQPIIIALARGFKKKVEPELQQAFQEGRILFITPFTKSVKRVSSENAMVRNKMMIELADNIVIGNSSSGGTVEKLLMNIKGKKIVFLNQI